tara:strand:+ start:3550 stop:5112 length:1563 start_codon:yes stop_codon:yes gene_type:complete
MDNFPGKDTLVDVFRWRVEKTPDALFSKFKERELTYADLDNNANKVSQGIINEGCNPDSRVAFLAKNSDHFCEFLYGTMKSRTVCVGINWRLAPPEVSYVLNDSKSEILFVGPEFYDLIIEIQDEIPSVKKIITMEESSQDWEDYVTWRDRNENEDPNLKSNPNDDIIQMYTSGTTGYPKGVQLTNKNFVEAQKTVLQVWGKDWHEGSVNLICSPIFHAAGANMVVIGIVFGCTNIIIPEVDPELILSLVEKEKIELALLVPAVILFLIQHPKAKSTDFSSLRQIIYGASPIAEDTLLKAIDIMGCDFWQVYGLTETTGLGATMSPEDHDPKKGKLRSCGKAYPGIDVKIVDEKNNELPVGGVGEILLKGDIIMKGYWNKPEANEESIVDGWFYTGDAGYFDDEGFLYIHDRVKDMIVSGGENVYPAEVENALMAHENISDAAVIGIPDDKWGEAVKAIVVINNDLSEDEIIEFVRTRIAGYKCPKSIDFIEELPRNPGGKILRRELRVPYWKGKDRNVS